jgi:hypothetical protein
MGFLKIEKSWKIPARSELKSSVQCLFYLGYANAYNLTGIIFNF